jgi:putative membrane protein
VSLGTRPLSTGATAVERAPSARVIALVERLLLVAGVVLFVVLLYRLGAGAVWSNLRLIGWGFVLIIGQEILAMLFNTFGWRSAFPRPRPPIPFGQLFGARVAGDAINNVTPTATVGGEVIRARMLDGIADRTAVWASVAIAKLTQTASQVVFIILGLVLVVEETPMPDAVRHGLVIGLGLLTAGVVIAIALQRRGFFTTAAAFARRLGLPVPARLSTQLQALDEEVARFYAAPGPFVASSAFFFLGWLMGVVEIYLILHFLDAGPSIRRALTIEVLSIAIDAILFFVPAKAGTQEGGKVLIFSILGLDPAKGLALGIARRIRELFWSLVGLVILTRDQSRRAV